MISTGKGKLLMIWISLGGFLSFLRVSCLWIFVSNTGMWFDPYACFLYPEVLLVARGHQWTFASTVGFSFVLVMGSLVFTGIWVVIFVRVNRFFLDDHAHNQAD